MTLSNKDTKQAIIDAAIRLFTTKGYADTSVRDIAMKAKVNVATISYYFNGKQGLLESLLTNFYEQYINVMESVLKQSLDNNSPRDTLICLVHNVFEYQKKNPQLTRLVVRELSLDNVLIREIMSTYLTKEKFIIKSLLEKGVAHGQFRKVTLSLFLMQLKSLLSMPFLHSHYLIEVLHIQSHDKHTWHLFEEEVINWLELTLFIYPSKQVS
ncbi:TetR/AcrR family transcriptional regulator [Bacillus sp. HMF5848]|uniref:forespore capture DNA-binding protein RefZ n=1 Tax=Bacillus sp. HMF5848 TaxID=2495421 RepID=UPI000F78DB83|nr:forespore capture DNA-binding protein RefZ [Bacillus sp. HMF5848]RSK28187.1 TetR/AcrR family transcriptional regulator [Bacillus sp. HMF5848]